MASGAGVGKNVLSLLIGDGASVVVVVVVRVYFSLAAASRFWLTRTLTDRLTLNLVMAVGFCAFTGVTIITSSSVLDAS